MSLITLTTDFGIRDYFIGVMKGVILGINPQADIVDLAHDLPAHDVLMGAFSLFTSYKYFPAGTIHVAVVDPGVGSSRIILAVRVGAYMIIAPDNGLISYILDETPADEIRGIENARIRLDSISQTFHGRDIMAPAAAHLSRGMPMEELGPRLPSVVRLPPFSARVNSEGIEGRVVYVDRFGNLMTNISNQDLAASTRRSPTIIIGPVTVHGLTASYSSVPRGAYLAVPGSTGYLEIARNMERAENPPDLSLGTRVTVRW
jgi:S-adenosylmethionine hydrolase